MQDAQTELFQFPYSHYNEKARWALDFKNVPHRRTNVLPGPHTITIKRMTGQNQVPVVRFADDIVHGSADIIDELEKRYPDPPLYPRDPVLRARCRQFEAAADEIIFPNVWDLVEEGLYPAATGERDPGRLREAQDALSQRHAELDKRLADVDFLCGDFSVADIGTFIMLSSGATLGAPVSERCTNLHGWLERLGKRPAFAAEMIGMQSFLAGVLKPTA
jgi:glutathione S-transferase